MKHPMFSLALVGLLALAACGGGGDGLVASNAPALNTFEQSLVGTYSLANFKLYDTADGPCVPGDLAEWGGSFQLRSDGSAHLTLEFCRQAGIPEMQCNHDYGWTADAGVIQLVSQDPGAPNVLLVWDKADYGGIRTEVYVPINRPDVGFVTVADGRESFDWIKQE